MIANNLTLIIIQQTKIEVESEKFDVCKLGNGQMDKGWKEPMDEKRMQKWTNKWMGMQQMNK